MGRAANFMGGLQGEGGDRPHPTKSEANIISKAFKN